MSKVCEICGKHAVAGRSVSHSHRTVNRKFSPKIQHVTIVQDGKRKKMNVCTTCLKKGNLVRGEVCAPGMTPRQASLEF